MSNEDVANMDLEKGATEPLTGAGSGSKDLASSPSKVKFTTAGDGAESEAVNIVSTGSGSYGLTKSELMVYANDPTWRKLRWGIFIAFWVCWFSMLVASFLIVANTSCGSKGSSTDDIDGSTTNAPSQ